MPNIKSLQISFYTLIICISTNFLLDSTHEIQKQLTLPVQYLNKFLFMTMELSTSNIGEFWCESKVN